MKYIKKIFSWIVHNKDWLFSGLGISIITLIATIFINNKGKAIDGMDKSNNNNIGINSNVDGNIYQDIIINNFSGENNNTSETAISAPLLQDEKI